MKPYLGKLSPTEKETLARISKKTIKPEERQEKPERSAPHLMRNDIKKD